MVAASAVDGGIVGAPSPRGAPGDSFPIVGIGASAGGLEAFIMLLKHLPVDTGMAFVLIQHLDPSHPSLLGEVLGKATLMPVREARNGELVEPNHIYVTPPNADLSLEDGALTLERRKEGARHGQLHLPIDSFFATLAAKRGYRAIGVILSGTASDGTEGLKAIKAEGGITLAQAPETAKFSSMPQSAIDAGVVDHVMPLPELAEELVRLSRHPYVAARPAPVLPDSQTPPQAIETGTPTDAPDQATGDRTSLAKIIDIVKDVVGVDFNEYKSPTFERRLSRRMALLRIENQTSYIQLLERDPHEVRALYEDALIHVSSFFRDPEVFETLKLKVFPEIVKGKADGAPIRVWVAGCSTGEEVYSLAMSLLEFLADSSHPHPLQIFGSDISEQSIQTARAGRFFEGALRGVSEDLRRRYFAKLEAGYRVNKSVRDLCVFVRHDLARDPPFSRLDLLSCRNVLIYFDHGLQQRVVPTFHYSLNQPGFLLLGLAEDIPGFAPLFSPVDRSRKIFARTSAPSVLRFGASPDSTLPRIQGISAGAAQFPRRARDLGMHLDSFLLARYAPPGVLVNEKMEVLQFRGQTGAYLQPAPGEPQNNLLKMARGGLLAKLQIALASARREMAAVRTAGVEVDQDGFTRKCDIVVLPFPDPPEMQGPLFIVLFEEVASAEAPSKSPRRSSTPIDAFDGETDAARRIPKLEHELSATTEFLHALIEQHSRTSHDLGSVNEDLVSGNEELQRLNEELETAKEELQSTNEELTTVNDELHHRNLEVGQINSDLANLLDTVDVPVVILDKQRHIRRFTPNAQSLLNVQPSDVGRLFDEIKPKIEVPDLDRQIAEVISAFAARESEVQDRDGHWYRMQIRPYQTAAGAVDGAIVSLFDIDSLKHHVREAQQAKDEAERADRAKDDFLAVLSHELRTPLSALLIQVQLLRLGGADTAKRERACDAIERSTKLQVKLIDDLLDVSRIVTGKMKVDSQPVNLAVLIEGTVDTFAALIARKSITLKVDLERSSSRISGDKIRLEQVVSNVLINAIKFTPSGGTIEVSLRMAKKLAHITVRDNGIGIEAEFLPRIFDRLIQKDSSSTRTHAGLGLGLAIVRHLVEAHGGTVTAASPGIGRGSTFDITLPLMKARPTGVSGSSPLAPAPAQRNQSRGPSPSDLAGQRILIIEDDVWTREGLAEMMTQAGLVVRTADSAAAGMTVFREFRPHALICDIAMPTEDGYSFIRRVRELGPEEGGDTPALAVTALAGEKNRQQAISGGFQIHHTKPVDMASLTASVLELLAARNGSDPDGDGGGDGGAEPAQPQDAP